MKLSSYFQKLRLILFFSVFNRSHFIEPNLYLFNLEKEHLPLANKILFELNNSEFIHLGDHLFFLPLIKSLIDAGYQVEINCSPLMFEFFNRLGLPVLSVVPQYETYDLIISRFELIPRLSRFKALLVHVSQNLSMPICSQLLHSFSICFNTSLNSRENFATFKNSNVLERLNLPQNKRLVLFNWYCDSSSYLITKKKKADLIRIAKAYAANPDYALVWVGTKKDKLKEPLINHFQHIDLRGKTDVIDVFELVNDPKVEIYIGFDAFVMHVFSLLGKKSIVKFRGRLTNKQTEMLSKYHVNLFNDHQYVTLI